MFQATADRVFVLAKEESNKLDSGLYIPDGISRVQAFEAGIAECEVASVGPDVRDIKEGDTVIFVQSVARPIKGRDGTNYYILFEKEVVAITSRKQEK